MKVKDHHIKQALAKKHREDFFLTEVKNGATQMVRRGELLILDALAVKRSWANPCFTGYEIKVSRHDFKRDEKWHGYKDLCHKFSFVCPSGLIETEELPEDVGLIYYNYEKKSLYTKKKALYRQIEMSPDLLYYIIICRLESSQYPFFSSKQEYFEEWLQRKKSTRELGWVVRSRLLDEVKALKKQVDDLELDNSFLKSQQESNEQIMAILREHGIKTSRWTIKEDLRKALSNSMPPGIEQAIDQIASGLDILQRTTAPGRGGKEHEDEKSDI